MNILLLMMGGSGTRYGADIPKQFVLVQGVPIFAYILEKYGRMPEIDHIICVSHGEWVDYVREWGEKLGVKKLNCVVAGGSTRSGSVKNGLEAASRIASDGDVILIHDATHPYVDIEGTLEVIEAVRSCGGATLGELQYDTVYRMDENLEICEVVPRREIVAGASPEAFLFELIYPVYANADDEELERMTSAGAIALAHHIPMKVIPTDLINLKITRKPDMAAFKKLLTDYYF